MCNRYSAHARENIRKYGMILNPQFLIDEDWGPIYNIPPTSRVPVVIRDEVQPGRLMSWGTKTHHGLLMNARSEAILETPTWKEPVQKRRCLMLADGFFEWETAAKNKLGHYFTIKNQSAFALAAIWFPGDADQPERVVMVTCAPNAIVAPFHDRMPVILPVDAAREWMKNATATPDFIARLCQSFPAEKMNEWRTTPRMNRVTYQEPDAIQPFREPTAEERRELF